MLRRLTILAIGVWLAASVPLALGQDGRNGPPSSPLPSSIDRSAGPAALPTNLGSLPPAIPPVTSPNPPPTPSPPVTIPRDLGMLPPPDLPMPSPNPPPAPAPPGITIPPATGYGSLATAPTIPMLPDQQLDPRLNWSLGDYGPNTRFVASDLNPPGQHLGWYADFDIGILKPHLIRTSRHPRDLPAQQVDQLPWAHRRWTGLVCRSFRRDIGSVKGQANCG